MENLLEVKNLVKYFPISAGGFIRRKYIDCRAVDDISFKANPGEIFGLLGPNGAGKTTTLRCISTLIKPTEGQITVNDLDNQKNSSEVRGNIAFLTNELKLDEHFTANDTIKYFGERKKIWKVHFRNVNETLPHFVETFMDDGYMDMYKVMKALREVNFDGALIADHVQNMVGGRRVGLAYSIGYMRALLERANAEVV